MRRASGYRSRSGCSTCRARHVKCDERRPECLNCQKLRRPCGGYSSLSPATSELAKQADSRLLRQICIGLASSELNDIEYYHYNMATSLSGMYHRGFFQDMLPRLAIHDAIVRRALSAFVKMHDCVLNGQHSPIERAAREDRALQDYNEAIARVMPLMSNGQSYHILLSVCVLFICIELLRSNTASALSHIDGGLRALESWNASLRARDDSLSLSSEDARYMQYTFMPMSAWRSQITANYDIFGLNKVRRPVIMPNIACDGIMGATRGLQTMDAASLSLLAIVSDCMQLAKTCGKLGYGGAVDTTLYQWQFRLLQNLAKWQKQHEAHIKQDQLSGSTPSPQSSLNERSWSKFLLANSHAVYLWIQGYFYQSETDWDAAKARFECTVELMEDVMNDRSPDLCTSSFSFEIKFIPVAVFVMAKCRCPSIRRRCLALLQKCSGQEGIWSATDMSKVYAKVMELEEAAMGTAERNASTSSSIDADHLPPEHRRIHHIEVAPATGDARGRTVNFSSFCPQTGTRSVRARYLALENTTVLQWPNAKFGIMVNTET